MEKMKTKHLHCKEEHLSVECQCQCQCMPCDEDTGSKAASVGQGEQWRDWQRQSCGVVCGLVSTGQEVEGRTVRQCGEGSVLGQMFKAEL